MCPYPPPPPKKNSILPQMIKARINTLLVWNNKFPVFKIFFLTLFGAFVLSNIFLHHDDA